MSANITVVGGANIDICTKSKNPLIDYDSNIGEIEFALGGVGRNIAEDLSLFGADVSLLTAIGDDSFGSVVTDNAQEQGLMLIASPFEGEKTGVYVSVNNSDGSFVVGINDMGISSLLTPKFVEKYINSLYFADYVVLEANLPQETIGYVCSQNFTLIADCVSACKCRRFESYLDKIWLLKANLAEARALAGDENFTANRCIEVLVKKGLKQGIVTLGRDGAMVFRKTGEKIRVYYVSNLPDETPKENTSGCGDALLAGFVMGVIRGRNFKDALEMGQAAAYLNSQSFASVNRNMTFSALKEAVNLFREKAEKHEEEIQL